MERTFFEVTDNIITNAAVFEDEEMALEMGFRPYIDGKWIGDRYDDTPTNAELAAKNALQEAQITAVSDRQEFIEDVMAEFMIAVFGAME